MLIWLLGLLPAGAVVQQLAEARDRRRHPAPGRLVDVGDATVHVVVKGSGPAVLIDSGLGGSSIEWARVIDDLAADFTVVAYDRPGFAWSPSSSCDRRAVPAARRMLALIDALKLETPVILVGHSLGGIHVRAAAALRHDLVRGLVLVDPSHEGMLDLADASKAAAATSAVTRVASWLAPLGLGRLVGRGFARLALGERRQPFADGEADRAHVAQLLSLRTGHGLRALAAEHACLAQSLSQLATLDEPDLPLTVITAAAQSDTPKLVEARAQIDAMHADLVDRRKGRQVLAEKSGHLVPLDQPEIVVQCVRELAGS